MHKTTSDRIRHPAKVNHRTKTQRAPKEKDLIATIVTATKQDSLKARRHRVENAPNKMQNARIATAAISPHAAKTGAGSAESARFSAPGKTPGPMALSGTSLHHHNKDRVKVAAITRKPALNQWINAPRATVVISDITAIITTSGKTMAAIESDMEWSARVVTSIEATAHSSRKTARASHKKASAAGMHAHKVDIRHLQEGQASKRCSIFSK